MILTDRQQLKLIDARQRPCLELLSFSVRQMLAAIRGQCFQDITIPVSLKFVDCGPLACIFCDDEKATICIHQLLNGIDTPKEVVSTIIKHELLHLRIRPVTVEGKEDQHPPAFRAAEAEVAPERRAAWCWIYANFAVCLSIRRRKQRIDVQSNWREVWQRRRLSIAECRELVGHTTEEEEAEGLW